MSHQLVLITFLPLFTHRRRSYRSNDVVRSSDCSIIQYLHFAAERLVNQIV
jgi:hypothetical protein